MARANDHFAERLRTRLNGEYAALFSQAGACSPAAARQAGIKPEAIAASTAEALGIEFTESLTHLPASRDFLSRVPIGFARSHCLLGLAGENGSMRLAMADLAQWPQVRILTKTIGRPVVPLFAPREEILRAVSAAYETQTGQAERVIQELDKDEVFRELSATAQSEDLLDVANRAPVIKLVNLILFEAVKRRASDVHIQPYEDSLVVRLRLDGVLYDVFQPPKALQEEITSRIKVMGGMNIAERRLPQDGRATVEVGDRVVDLRIATLPTHVGERVVIRLLDKSARLYTLDELGMPAGVLGGFRRLVHQDHGIILVTGPTGSGKTTTLYAALQEIDATEFNILTPHGDQPDTDQRKEGDDLCDRPAARPPPGSGRHHGGGDPRRRDRPDGHPVGTHGPPRVLDAPHQRRLRGDCAASGPRGGTVSCSLVPAGGPRAAPRAPHLPRLPHSP
jgi:hypothetical protein